MKVESNRVRHLLHALTGDAVYGPRFWATYAANLALMIAVSLLFRYANFVASLGGSEAQLGWITGLGMVGGISARCFLGLAIDRHGAGRVWLLSLMLLVGCLLGHLAVDSLRPPWIQLLRILYTVSLAGAFGASITFITFRAPPHRMGEMIGMLGSSGFIGMAIGPVLGDRLFMEAAHETLSMFCWAAAAASVSLICTVVATYGADGPPSDLEQVDPKHCGQSPGDLPGQTDCSEENRCVESGQRPPDRLWILIRTYHPGWTLLVGFVMGMGIGTPSTFVSALAEVKQITNLTWFWLPYAAIAFLVRVLTRTLSDRWGTRPTILVGLLCLAASMFSYLLVRGAQSLVVPAALGGISHAFLFPATVAEGNQAFPAQYRGLATTLILMMFDIGLLIGQPVFGWAVEFSRQAGFDGYAAAFAGQGTWFLLATAIYAIAKPRRSRFVPPGKDAGVDLKSAHPLGSGRTESTTRREVIESGEPNV